MSPTATLITASIFALMMAGIFLGSLWIMENMKCPGALTIFETYSRIYRIQQQRLQLAHQRNVPKYKFLVNQTRFVTKRFADFKIGDVLGVLTITPLKKYSSPNLLPSQADSVGHVGVKVSDTTIRWGTPELFGGPEDRYSENHVTTQHVPPHQHYAVPTNVVVSVEF